MKVPPLTLNPAEVNRVGMSLPFSPGALFGWRNSLPMGFSQSASTNPVPPLDLKSSVDLPQLPCGLNAEPRTWSREDVLKFLRWIETEFDVAPIDQTKFYMNGKALVMLNRSDLLERSPGAGDIVHNALQQIVNASMHVPPSPLTPHHPMLSPSPLTSNTTSFHNSTWPLMPAELLLWDFLQQLLNDKEQKYARYIAWRNAETGVFKIVDPQGLAKLWGIQKNHLSMNYDKMSRALRYYYRVNILRKVQGERHCYQFLRNPSELRSIKNISSLKIPPIAPRPPVSQHSQQFAPQYQHQIQQQSIPSAPVKLSPTHFMDQDEGPTDLSMSSNYHSYSVDMSESSHDMKVESPYYDDVKTEEDMTISVDYAG